MSSVIGRRQLYQSFNQSSDSESDKFNIYERSSTKSNKIDYSPKSYKFWGKEETFEEFHTVHEPSVCFFNFVDELKSNLNLKLPDYSFDSLCKELNFRLQNIICCSVFEIKKTIESCYKVIQNFEDFNIKEGKILIGKFGFKLILEDNGSSFGSKEEIANDFFVVQSKSSKNREFLEIAKNFCSDLEVKMADSFYESIRPDLIKEVNTNILLLNSNFDKELHNYQLRKVALESCNMKKEIEWTKTKIRVLKVQLEKKLHDLKNKEEEIKLQSFKLEQKTKDLTNKEEEIKHQNLILNSEKKKLEQERTNYNLSLKKLELNREKFLQFKEDFKDLACTLSKTIQINDEAIGSPNPLLNVDNSKVFEEKQKVLNNKVKDIKGFLNSQKLEEKESNSNQIKIIDKSFEVVKLESEFSPIKVHQNSSVPQNIKQSMLIKQESLRNNSKIKKTKTLSLVFAPVLSASRHSPGPQLQSAYTRSPSNPVSYQKKSHESKNKSICNSNSRNRFKSPALAGIFYNHDDINLEFNQKEGLEMFNLLDLKKAKSNEKRKVSNKNAKVIQKKPFSKLFQKDSFEIIKEERIKIIEENKKSLEGMDNELEKKNPVNSIGEKGTGLEKLVLRNMMSDLAQRLENILKMMNEVSLND